MTYSPPVAVVTGASRGLGAAIATTLVSRGCRVALGGREVDALLEVAARLGEGSTSVHPGDVRPMPTHDHTP